MNLKNRNTTGLAELNDVDDKQFKIQIVTMDENGSVLATDDLTNPIVVLGNCRVNVNVNNNINT